VSKCEISSFIKLQLNYISLILIYFNRALQKVRILSPCLRAKLRNNRRHVRCHEGRIGSTKARIRKYSRMGCNTLSLS